MKLNRTFTISLCLNLALAGAAVYLLKKPVSLRSRESAATISETPTAPAVASRPVANTPSASVTYVTNRFAWSKVEADDFEQLALNLRAIGCPEKTIRDVLIARTRRLLERASTDAEAKLPFWTAGLRRTRANREAARQTSLAHQKIIARLEGVIGKDVFMVDTKLTDHFENQAIMRFMVGPMPDEIFFKVAAKGAWFGERHDELAARSGGVWLDTDEAELAQLQARYWLELAALLTPAQLEEMTARAAMMPLMEKVQFEATDLNPAEARQLALIRARFNDPISDEWFKGNTLSEEQEASLQAAERQFLGEARFAQFERAADSDFKTLFQLGRDNNLPRAAAESVFEMRQLAAQEVGRLREAKSFSDAERKQRLAQMQVAAQQAALQVLGANVCGQYLGRGGQWLTNANGL